MYNVYPTSSAIDQSTTHFGLECRSSQNNLIVVTSGPIMGEYQPVCWVIIIIEVIKLRSPNVKWGGGVLNRIIK